jgi:hypothetical protein
MRSQVTRFECDRCRQKYTGDADEIPYGWSTFCIRRSDAGGRNVELCVTCTDKLMDFVQGR